jgi:ABC-2 type transport system permease protein
VHRILLIAKRDYLASIRAKAFLVGLIVAPLLFGSGFIGMGVMKRKPDILDRRVAIVDHTGKTAAAVIEAAVAKNQKELFDKTTGRQVKPRYIFETVTVDGANPNGLRLELSERIRRKELFAFVEIGQATLHLAREVDENDEKKEIPVEQRISYYSNASGIDETRMWIGGPLNEGLRRVRLAELGVEPSRFRELFASVPVQTMSLVSRDERTGIIREARKKGDLEGFAVPLTMMMLLAMIVLASSSPMLGAVADDKTQRVFEMLLGSATPFELMMGKVLASVALSLTSSVFYVTGGLLVLQGMAMIGLAPFSLLPWFLVYLVADVMILSAFAAALGSACSSPHDAQQLAVLLISPVIVPMMLMMPVMQQPNGGLATALSLFPPFTPMLMLMRQAMPAGVPAWQPIVGMAGVLVCTVVGTWAAARIFRVAILLQGKPPKMAELVRWAVRG